MIINKYNLDLVDIGDNFLVFASTLINIFYEINDYIKVKGF